MLGSQARRSRRRIALARGSCGRIRGAAACIGRGRIGGFGRRGGRRVVGGRIGTWWVVVRLVGLRGRLGVGWDGMELRLRGRFGSGVRVE